MTSIPRGQTPERRAYMKAWNAANPKRDRRAYKAAYDKSHKKQIAEYVAANSDRLKEKAATYYTAHRAQILARVKARSDAQRERILAYQAKYYSENTEKVKGNVSAYRKANPDKKKHIENRRRARKAGNGGGHTMQERLEKFAQLGNACFYCGLAKQLTVDHMTPLSRGGTDSISNIVPACRSCNSRKNARTAEEFLAFLGLAA